MHVAIYVFDHEAECFPSFADVYQARYAVFQMLSITIVLVPIICISAGGFTCNTLWHFDLLSGSKGYKIKKVLIHTKNAC